MSTTTTTTASDHASGDRSRPELHWWREVIYVVVIYVVYSAVRNRFGSSGGGAATSESAFNHAKAIIEIQRTMGLYFEDRLQSWYLDLPGDGVIRFWNIFYGTAHFIVTAFALIWRYRKDPSGYPRWRNTLAFTTLAALIGFASFSLMPPRLLDDPGEFGGCQDYNPEAAAAAPDGALQAPGCNEFGFVDTLAVHGGWLSFGQEGVKQISNQYAAMPSMHIGWASWSAFVMWPMIRRRWVKAVVVLYPLLTLFCIMVTANHYWIDAPGGLLALAAGYSVARWVVPRFWDKVGRQRTA